MVMKKSKVMFLAISVVLFFVGCTKQVFVMDGDCEPIEEAEIYYTRAGIYSFKPFGPFYTSQKGIVPVPSDVDSLTIKKEKYKYCHLVSEIDDSFSWPVKVFLYKETEQYESGLTDWKKCMEND